MLKKDMNPDGVNPGGPGNPERSGDERSEASRSGGFPGPRPAKETEVVQKARRRRFTAEFKRRIVDEANACGSGELGALLRREGLYHSHLVTWRRQFNRGALSALEPRKRGPKRKVSGESIEMTRLRKENERLRKQLENAEIIIDAQKKLQAVLDSIRDRNNESSS